MEAEARMKNDADHTRVHCYASPYTNNIWCLNSQYKKFFPFKKKVNMLEFCSYLTTAGKVCSALWSMQYRYVTIKHYEFWFETARIYTLCFWPTAAKWSCKHIPPFHKSLLTQHCWTSVNNIHIHCQCGISALTVPVLFLHCNYKKNMRCGVWRCLYPSWRLFEAAGLKGTDYLYLFQKLLLRK